MPTANPSAAPNPSSHSSPSLWALPAEVFAPGLVRRVRAGRELLIDRFWSHVVPAAGCWLWPGERRSNGYGLYEVELARYAVGAWEGRRVRFRAHRFAFEACHGPIPDGALVMHDCNVKLCCRPDHLRLGTHRDNAHDALRSGLVERCHLTPDQVRAVRARLAGGEGRKAIAETLGVNWRVVERIRRGKSYRWVEAA